MRRADYVYLLQAESTLYVGQATTPGRALNHWFGTHNAGLRRAVDAAVAANRWPRMRILPLPAPNLEDLHNAETLLIAVLKDDRRTAALTSNGSPGNSLFKPLPWSDPDCADEPAGGIALDWQRFNVPPGPDDTDAPHSYEFELKTVALATPGTAPPRGLQRELARPFLRPENADAVVRAVEVLFEDPRAAAAPWTSFFNHLKAFDVRLDDLPDPTGGPVTFSGLARRLDAPYVLVNLTIGKLDDRGAVGVGLTEPVLRSRAEKWWSRGSLSLTGGRESSLQHAAGAPEARRPRYVVATVGGTAGRRVVLAAWPLQERSWEPEDPRPEHRRKLVLPIGPPDPQDPATARGAKVIGTLLQDRTSLGGRGAFWVDALDDDIL